jgi:hypothetical protein
MAFMSLIGNYPAWREKFCHSAYPAWREKVVMTHVSLVYPAHREKFGVALKLSYY